MSIPYSAAPTLEQFMAEPQDEHDDVDLPSDPLSSIADSLRQLLNLAHAGHDEEKASDLLREAHDDLDAKHAVLHDLVLEIEEIIKPSTSKLANSVRAAIDRWRGVETEPTESAGEPETVDPGPVPVPERDADVEAWREYAEAQGVTEDLSQLNRSQIRTLLGIAQA